MYINIICVRLTSRDIIKKEASPCGGQCRVLPPIEGDLGWWWCLWEAGTEQDLAFEGERLGGGGGGREEEEEEGEEEEW
jgi:hypothetical protein